MIAISWDHWASPLGWPRIFPFELFLFFFLVLTGYLITGGLLRERDRKEEKRMPWRAAALKNYQIRRGLRILAPYYAALAFGLLIQARDIWQAPLWYFLHASNIHVALIGYWPDGTSHFWSLAMQQQFYLVWPFVIWFLPRQWLPAAMLLCAAISPITRLFHPALQATFAWPQLLTWDSLDYFAIGGLFALAQHRGMSLESPALKILSWVCLACYVTLFGADALGYPTFGLRSVQQTFLSVSLCGFIAAAIVGFQGAVGKILENGVLQKIGQLSYGIYLYHNMAPLAAGKILPWIFWNPWFETVPGVMIRMIIYAAITWTLALASWRWIESPLQSVRSRMAASA